MAKEQLSYVVFYPAMSYEKTYQKTNCTLPKYFKVDNYPPTKSEPNTAEKKKEFLDLMKDEKYDVLMAWYGGQVENNGDKSNSSLQLVEALDSNDWGLISNSKKKVVGRSDITFLLCRLMQRGVRCYYGPNYSSFADDFKKDSTIAACVAEKNIEISKKYLELALAATEEYVIDFKGQEFDDEGINPWVFQEGRCTGRLIGGNLDTIFGMIRKYDPNGFQFQKGDILLLESVDPMYSWSQEKGIFGSYCDMLAELKNRGVFDRVSGVILGKSKEPKVFDEEKGFCFDLVSNETEKNYMHEAIKKTITRNIPILANVPCSHTTPMVTLPLGRTVTLDVDNCTLCIHPE